MNNNDNKSKINNLIQRLNKLRLQRERITQEESVIHSELLSLLSEHHLVKTSPNTLVKAR